MIIHDLYMTANGYALAACKSAELTIKHDLVEIIPDEDWQWRDYVDGKITWSVNCSGLVTAEVPAVEVASTDILLMKGQTIDIIFMLGNGRQVGGRALIESIRLASQVGNVATYATALKGCGKLSPVTEGQSDQT